MTLIIGIILFTLLWAFGFAGLMDVFGPVSRRFKAFSSQKPLKAPEFKKPYLLS